MKLNYLEIKKFTIKNILKKVKKIAEQFQGVDFTVCLESEDVGFNPEIVYRSAPSGNKYLKHVLKYINVTEKDSIIDIGCGKGSAMRVMLKFPFARVDGIEISEHITNIAINNFKTLNIKKSTIFCCDVTTFKHFNNYNIFYLYNPFPPEIFRIFLQTLKGSCKNPNKEILIIYNNPICHNIIIEKKEFSKIREFPDEWGNKIYLYSNKSIEFSRLKHLRVIQ